MYVPTARQREAIKLISSTRHTMLYGGSRSGKTFIAIRAIIVRAAKHKSRHLIVRHRFNHAKTSIWADTLPKVLDMTMSRAGYDINRSDYFVRLINGSEIWLGGIDDKDRSEKILGNEYSTIFANECSQISYSAITTLQTRLAERTSLSNKFVYDCNPPSVKHWTHKLFVERVDPVSGESKGTEYNYLQMNPIDNREHLPDGYIEETLAGLPPRLRRRFLDGEFQLDVDGALWNDELIGAHRVDEVPPLKRTVVAIDPPVTSGENADECGIVVAGIDGDGHIYVLADYTMARATPSAWARRAIEAYHEFQADRIVAEVNQGGDMVEMMLKQVDNRIPYRAVRATKGKYVRAEPISDMYYQGKVHHVGVHLELEAQMTEFTADFDRNAMGYSPDRVDALVWAVTELGVRQRLVPRIRSFA